METLSAHYARLFGIDDSWRVDSVALRLEERVSFRQICEFSAAKGLPGGPHQGSEHVELAVAVAFGCLEATAEFENIVLQRAGLGLVDRAAEVAD
jgi:hypothetical protein